MARQSLLALACAVHSSNALRPIFGMGVYNDTPYEPAVTLQLGSALNLTGSGGWVLLFFEDIDPIGNSPPAPWEMQGLADALSMGLQPIVRIGQAARNYRYCSDDAEHLHYTKLGAVYATFVSSLLAGAAALLHDFTPLAANAPNVLIQVANEPNECVEWQCNEGAGVYLPWTRTAVEFAAYARDMNAALNALPSAWTPSAAPSSAVSLTFSPMVSPLGQAGAGLCECVGGGGNNSGFINSTSFIDVMLQQVPDLYTNVYYHCAHTYPSCVESINAPNGCAMTWMTNYQRERVLITASREAAGMNGSLPVVIGECGWPGHNETGKAVWIVEAFNQIWLPDPGVVAVTPFLLAGNFYVWQQQGWPWTTWDNTTRTTITAVAPQYEAVYNLIREGGA